MPNVIKYHWSTEDVTNTDMSISISYSDTNIFGSLVSADASSFFYSIPDSTYWSADGSNYNTIIKTSSDWLKGDPASAKIHMRHVIVEKDNDSVEVYA